LGLLGKGYTGFAVGREDNGSEMRCWRIYYKNQQGIQGDGAETWEETILSSGTANGGTEPNRNRRQVFEHFLFISYYYSYDCTLVHTHFVTRPARCSLLYHTSLEVHRHFFHIP